MVAAQQVGIKPARCVGGSPQFKSLEFLSCNFAGVRSRKCVGLGVEAGGLLYLSLPILVPVVGNIASINGCPGPGFAHPGACVWVTSLGLSQRLQN